MKKDSYVPYEQQYRENTLAVLKSGVPCDAERTGTGTRMMTGLSYRVDLQREFPILSTKTMAIDKIAAENIWFIAGSTDNNKLKALGAGIWNAWADDCGQLGPLYGAMWRRRPATNIQYVRKTQEEPQGCTRVTARFFKANCQASFDFTGDQSQPIIDRMKAIRALWHEMITKVVAEKSKVKASWMYFEGFYEDFDRISGNELIHVSDSATCGVSAKKLVITNSQSATNTYCLDTVCVVPEYLDREYPRKKITQDNGDVFYMCPVFYIDQLGIAIEQLRDHSQSRRIVVDCWDPSLLPADGIAPKDQAKYGLQALAPCHPLFQFNVVPAHGGKQAQLDLCVYMRSQDMFLGTPYNMAGYAMIAHMVAKVTGLKPGILTMTGGNCHIYANHVKQLQKQSRRKIRPMVQLKELPDVQSIGDFKVSDFQLEGYNPAGTLRGAVAV